MNISNFRWGSIFCKKTMLPGRFGFGFRLVHRGFKGHAKYNDFQDSFPTRQGTFRKQAREYCRAFVRGATAAAKGYPSANRLNSVEDWQYFAEASILFVCDQPCVVVVTLFESRGFWRRRPKSAQA
jgi:hypothetical protein